MHVLHGRLWAKSKLLFGGHFKSQKLTEHGSQLAAWPMYWLTLSLYCAIHCEDAR